MLVLCSTCVGNSFICSTNVVLYMCVLYTRVLYTVVCHVHQFCNLRCILYCRKNTRGTTMVHSRKINRLHQYL